MPKAQKIPDGFHTVTPHLTIKGAAKAIEFYQRAFGAEKIESFAMPGRPELLLHASVVIGDSRIMLHDEMPDFGAFGPAEGKPPVTIHLYVEDADDVYTTAIAAGATVVMPLSDMFWGDRYAVVKDPFGHHWSIATHVEDVPPEAMEARCLAAFSQPGEGSAPQG
jgi:uncharacterized glyoxalase superfamily protein PhnB